MLEPESFEYGDIVVSAGLHGALLERESFGCGDIVVSAALHGPLLEPESFGYGDVVSADLRGPPLEPDFFGCSDIVVSEATSQTWAAKFVHIRLHCSMAINMTPDVIGGVGCSPDNTCSPCDAMRWRTDIARISPPTEGLLQRHFLVGCWCKLQSFFTAGANSHFNISVVGLQLLPTCTVAQLVEGLHEYLRWRNCYCKRCVAFGLEGWPSCAWVYVVYCSEATPPQSGRRNHSSNRLLRSDSQVVSLATKGKAGCDQIHISSTLSVQMGTRTDAGS